MESKTESNGKIIKIAGPVVVASGMAGVKMYEVVRVGKERLIGEVIELLEDKATIQVYEETSGIAPGAEVVATGSSLSVELGPGVIGNIYDGIMRPLNIIQEKSGEFIARGIEADSIDHKKKWPFKPLAKKGDKVTGGQIIGEVTETSMVVQRIMVPSDVEGELTEIVGEGSYTVKSTIAKVKTKDGETEINLMQKWPVRIPRPNKDKQEPSIPLITGQRILDTFNPLAKGGTAAIPGGFGTGKTVTQQSLAKWCDADIIVYIGCGERGNEMTDVLKTFPHLTDPRSGKPLLERTVIIANTSNMPVAAREASVYTGITIAEYFRDMGYDVALMADSTSRWAEAMREISSRLEEMPGEEGYPAYLATRLSQFYERAGRVKTLSGKEGSVSVIGAISPPGGDFSEPVTQNTLRVNKTFWALDKSLASRRHFPAINWLNSYSLYLESVTAWFNEHSGESWRDLRNKAMELLQKEEQLQEIVQLVGPDALPDTERLILEVTKILREDFLQQNAYHDVDAFCPIRKQTLMLKLILEFYDMAQAALKEGAPIDSIAGMKIKDSLARMKEHSNDTFEQHYEELKKNMTTEFSQIKSGGDSNE
ncbi:MAG: ATP synthase subunit A [Candidatus Woesearchaeota archaeon]|jgi:V/A-type H+-transporting ATPase subunit A|nr:ATP synthase subunit A [Candidatus Woesearchaeota archaeon]MDP7457540.1 ATP synthase subunit A [Candidatus Woesearchaeota archaeon]